MIGPKNLVWEGQMSFWTKHIGRRGFLRQAVSWFLLSLPLPFPKRLEAAVSPPNPVFWVKNIPDQPFTDSGHPNHHIGIETLLKSMGAKGLKFYRSKAETALSGPSGLIKPNDVVLIKVNAQWKYRGCTNGDLIRGLIQRVLDHPDGFKGEVVIVENGQGRGSLNCDTSKAYGNTWVRANANNMAHSFVYLVTKVFNDPRVSSYLLDPIRGTFIDAYDHLTDGYRTFENVSYPCFTTSGGRRVELRKGIWQGDKYTQNIKLINVPVLKTHKGSEITASLKHFYGLVSMSDGHSAERHYEGLGNTCGKMVVSVRPPVLNIVDAIWVSHLALSGYPADKTFRANQIMASQDPVALDYCAAKYIIYPIDNNPNHHPGAAAIDQWLTAACNLINARGGLYNLNNGILIHDTTKQESEMVIFKRRLP